MKYQFYKLQGAGNDFIFFEELKYGTIPPDPEKLSRELCKRNFSIGGDGIIFLVKSDSADAKMIIYNSDGSRAKMCGNGIRCAARLMFELGLVHGGSLVIDSDSGLRTIKVTCVNGEFFSASTDMGVPEFTPENIPVLSHSSDGIQFDFPEYGRIEVSCVSMGNPHAVAIVENARELDISKLGPYIETSPIFPDRTNTEFITVLSENEIDFRVWERGCGETLACGTGICAAAAVTVKKGLCRCDSPITVHAPGGELEALCSSNGHIYLTGPAEFIYKGEIEIHG
ncbi:MAG: diaminopimelate epimerase [Ruminococcaceae bacterium]|nr:diaminopimelate epimerase [Oscillospiraceae bacterium]